MTSDAFIKILKELQKKEECVLDRRADIYSANKDRMHNFKTISCRLKMKPSFIAFTLMNKHFVALEDWIYEYNNKSTSEINLNEFKQIEEWIIDIRNYLSFIYAMLYENIEREE